MDNVQPGKKHCTVPDCVGSFDLVPPFYPEYSIPTLDDAEGEDAMKTLYRCTEGHVIQVYWIKESREDAGIAVPITERSQG